MPSKMDKYSVWVGGVEVNDFYLSFDEAKLLASQYSDEGYDDVKIEKVEEE